jgi:hypothetical protein
MMAGFVPDLGDKHLVSLRALIDHVFSIASRLATSTAGTRDSLTAPGLDVPDQVCSTGRRRT